MSYIKGESFTDRYFLVKATREFSWGVIGTLTTCKDGDVSFKFGNEDIDGPRPTGGDILWVAGSVGEYNDAPQVTGHCQVVEATPEIVRNVVPVSSINFEQEFNFILSSAMDIRNFELREITAGLLRKNEKKLKQLPAGMAMHHACLGGWVEHTGGILRSAVALHSVYVERLNLDLLISGAILHDIGKILEFDLNPLGLVKDYTFLGDGIGHASLGVGMIMAYSKELKFNVTSPAIAALLNIVGAHAGNREWGACADPITKEAVVIAKLDYVDAHINGMTNALQGLDFGSKVYDKSTRQTIYRTTPFTDGNGRE